jgi:hypothetical protein
LHHFLILILVKEKTTIKGLNMPFLEALAIEVGTSIVKSVIKLWLKDYSIVSDTSSSIVDMLKVGAKDKLTQRRAERQFQAISEKVAENLLPIFETDGGKLDENSREAVALAVAKTLNIASASSDILAENDLDPSKLARHLLNVSPPEIKQFNFTEKALYERIVSESCEYIIDIASQLPEFTEQTFAEILKREGRLLGITEKILREMHEMREQLNPKTLTEHFELDYRRAVVRNLDDLQLFGTDISLPNRRHRLSVAYVMLSVYPKPIYSLNKQSRDRNKASRKSAKLWENESRTIVSVDKALADSNRLLIKGLAGSGKTTLLQWIAVISASNLSKAP